MANTNRDIQLLEEALSQLKNKEKDKFDVKSVIGYIYEGYIVEIKVKTTKYVNDEVGSFPQTVILTAAERLALAKILGKRL